MIYSKLQAKKLAIRLSIQNPNTEFGIFKLKNGYTVYKTSDIERLSSLFKIRFENAIRFWANIWFSSYVSTDNFTDSEILELAKS